MGPTEVFYLTFIFSARRRRNESRFDTDNASSANVNWKGWSLLGMTQKGDLANYMRQEQTQSPTFACCSLKPRLTERLRYC